MRNWRAIVGKNVRRFRRQKGLTQEQLAFDAEIDLTYVGGIERGKRNPSLMVMARIAEALSVPLTKLIADWSSLARLEIVVRRFQHDGAVDFEQGLAVLVGLFYVPVLHPPNSLLGCCESLSEQRIEHEAIPAAFAGAVARFDFSGGLASQLEREGSLPVGSSRPAMAAVPPSQAVRADAVVDLTVQSSQRRAPGIGVRSDGTDTPTQPGSERV
jgi:transcriptional regulator with XRE-family HTH domain